MCVIKGFREASCGLKFAYLLIAILAVFCAICYVKCCANHGHGISSGGSGGVSDSEIAEWVSNNPEAILDSVNKYVMRQQEEMQKQQQEKAGENIVKYRKELKDTKYSGVLNPSGTIEMVEFFDYNCHYCKLAKKNTDELLSKRKDVKIILRAIPILGDASKYATDVGVAILISDPSKYIKYYNMIMDGSARSQDDVHKVLADLGITKEAITNLLAKHKSKIDEIVSKNMKLAGDLGVNGTPAFIIKDELIPGAHDTETLNQKLKK